MFLISLSVFRWASRPGSLLGMAALLLPTHAIGQSRFEFNPSLGVAQLYDDNLFSVADAMQRDRILRVSPRLSTGWRAANWHVLARYALDAERFHHHPELDSARARQEAVIDVSYVPTARVRLRAVASYGDTKTPGELNLITGLELGRAPASRVYTNQSVSVDLGVVTNATLDHVFTHDRVLDLLSDAQTSSLTLERRFGPSDRARLAYGWGRFAFGSEVTISHLMTLGWNREVTPRAHFEIKAGPRLSGERLGAEISAGLRHAFLRGEVALEYLQTQTVVVGQKGPVTAEGIGATFSRQLLRALRVRGGPSVFRSRNEEFAATVYRLHVDAIWRLSNRLALVGSHMFSLQTGGTLGARREDISHNGLQLSVVAARAGS